MFQSKIKKWIEEAICSLPGGYYLCNLEEGISVKNLPAMSYNIYSYKERYEEGCSKIRLGLELNGYLKNPNKCKSREEFYNNQLTAIEMLQKDVRTVVWVLNKYYDTARIEGEVGAIEWNMFWCSTEHDLMRVRLRVLLDAEKAEPCCNVNMLNLECLESNTVKEKWTDKVLPTGRKLY